jgi:lysyl-tRNA synthetase class 2
VSQKNPESAQPPGEGPTDPTLPVPLPLRLARRHKAFAAVRRYFADRDFLEVDTVLLVPGPGLEPHIDPLAVPVRVDFNGPPVERFLITSPELAMKQLLARGIARLYQMGPVFRDGERTQRHTPTFQLLEWYRRGATLDDMQKDTEEIVANVAAALDAHPAVDVTRGFEVVTVADLFAAHTIDIAAALEEKSLAAQTRARGFHLRPGADDDDAFFAVMAHAEQTIGQTRPTLVTRWPAHMAVLARRCDDDPRFALRFEVYAGGLELCNAFDELTDPVEQRARFEADNAARAALGKRTLPLDEDFLRDLAHMPSAAGNALGIDRLLMVLLGLDLIDDVQGLPWR